MIYKKKVLWLMAIAIVMVIVSVACSGNPTNAGDYIVAKQAEQSPKPEMKLTVDTNQGLIQFKDLSFKSGAYYINGNYTKKIYYYADIKVDENSKPYISAITKSEDGEIIEEEGKFYETSTNESGEFYNLEGVRYQSGNKLTAEVTFNESGYLVIRFSNYSLDITYSLIEETYNGLIPKEFSGKYILPKTDDSYDYSDYFETTSSNFIIHSKGYYTKPIVLKDTNVNNGFSYNGKAILYYEDVNNPDATFTFFTNKQSKRQLIHGSLASSGWWSYYIHVDDINK
ncbi:hypothetical protein [Brachyspira sp.]|uniref:hypothetical protein n=1 Tax=Brachyspira sp. TaxID=1977261 RepID=UPI003D7E9BCD